MGRLGYSFACLILLMASTSFAQPIKPVPSSVIGMKSKGGTVCEASGLNIPHYIPPSKAFLNKNGGGLRVQNTAKFYVTYQGFSTEAQTAFQSAVDIWASLLQSPVTINVLAIWTPLSSSTRGFETLGSASPASFYANFDGAPRVNIFYPTALAEKLAGKNLNEVKRDSTTGAGYEIIAQFNSNATWDYSPTSVATGKVHLTTVVLHELGHGLGVYDTYGVSSGNGSFGLQGSTVPMAYDIGVQSNSARLLDQTNGSTALAASLTSGNVNYNVPLVRAANGNSAAELYAPNPWQPGSSIAHLDQTTYSGTNNELMRPQLDDGQVTLDPGPIIINMFKDMGWVAPYISHTPLKNTETTTTPFTITATITPDGSDGYSFDTTSVKMGYSINGSPITEVKMKVNGNQFTAILPAPVAIPTRYDYYIKLSDNLNRTLTKPGLIVNPGQADIQATFQFTAGPDTQPPHITHAPISFIRDTDTQLTINAVITDNIGVQNAAVQYQINGVAQPDLIMNNPSDSTYTATIHVSLSNGDVIKYRIKAVDSSVEQNVGYAPSSSTYYTVNVVGLLAAQGSYSNDFNSPSTDFFGDNLFSITTAPGFSDGAINTTHPYPESNPSDSISYVYELRIPITLSSSNAKMEFEEIVLVEPGKSGSTWPSPDFYDYVIVEGSKDSGSTWKKLINGYDCRAQSVWVTRWNSSVNSITGNSSAVGDPSLYRTRVIDMLATGYFKSGDAILIRFRLMSDQLASGWGWAIDNLNIQTPITAIEKITSEVFSTYPNPVTSDYLHVLVPSGLACSSMTVTDLLGRPVLEASLSSQGVDQKVFVGGLNDGMYIVRVNSDLGQVTKKIIIKR